MQSNKICTKLSSYIMIKRVGRFHTLECWERTEKSSYRLLHSWQKPLKFQSRPNKWSIVRSAQGRAFRLKCNYIQLFWWNESSNFIEANQTKLNSSTTTTNLYVVFNAPWNPWAARYLRKAKLIWAALRAVVVVDRRLPPFYMSARKIWSESVSCFFCVVALKFSFGKSLD